MDFKNYITKLTDFILSDVRISSLYIFTSVIIALLFYYINFKKKFITELAKLLKTWQLKFVLYDTAQFLINCSFMTAVSLVGFNQKNITEWLRKIFELKSDTTLAFEPTYISTISISVGIYLSAEFGYYFMHLLMHRNSVLWEFHKTHHAVKVLTPFSGARSHFVEIFLLTGSTFFFVTLFLVLFELIFSHGSIAANRATLFVSNIYIFYFLTLHLRHTAVPISYGKYLSRVLRSPLMHQIHHSIEKRHINKNMGLSISLFDWAFNTIYIPQHNENFAIGLTDVVEMEKLQSPVSWNILPVTNIYFKIVNYFRI